MLHADLLTNHEPKN